MIEAEPTDWGVSLSTVHGRGQKSANAGLEKSKRTKSKRAMAGVQRRARGMQETAPSGAAAIARLKL